MGEFEVGTKMKVVHYASKYLYSNFCEFWTKKKITKLNYKVCAGFEILEKESVTGPLASSPRRPIAVCPGPRARGSSVMAWSPPTTPPPHVRHPPPEDAPILSSLRQKPFCCPLLAAERHVKLPTSLLSMQHSAMSIA
jgi:hypothetical protein